MKENPDMNTITGPPVQMVTRAAAAGRPDGVLDSTSLPPSLTTTWKVLRFTFGLVPIVAGLDKFTNLLVNWDN
jgi:hypothetical protein